MFTQADTVAAVLSGAGANRVERVEAFAPANIALVKYWGKRDELLNLPVTSSLSLSLGSLGSRVHLSRCEGNDRVTLGGSPMGPDTEFRRRVSGFLDLFRDDPGSGFRVDAENSIPTAAGFASSASGFAALVLALDCLEGWGLDRQKLSILARLGSGSASRSVYAGLVEWHSGQAEDGLDSFAEPLSVQWPELRIGLLVVDDEPKKTGSRDAMRHTVATAPLYSSWPAVVANDLAAVHEAVKNRDFDLLGQTAEANALAMHATMMSARPSVRYWTTGSVEMMHRVCDAREGGLNVYFTMDAGPNLKLVYLQGEQEQLMRCFPDLVEASGSSAEPSASEL